MEKTELCKKQFLKGERWDAAVSDLTVSTGKESKPPKSSI